MQEAVRRALQLQPKSWEKSILDIEPGGQIEKEALGGQLRALDGGCSHAGCKRRPSGPWTDSICAGARPQLAPALWALLSWLVPSVSQRGRAQPPDMSHPQPGPAACRTLPPFPQKHKQQIESFQLQPRAKCEPSRLRTASWLGEKRGVGTRLLPGHCCGLMAFVLHTVCRWRGLGGYGCCIHC